jgi:PhnB protein
MSSEAKPISNDRQSVTPYMCIRNATAALDFYKKAFGATELMRLADPDGRIRHAELEIGNSKIMIVDEFAEFSEIRSTQSFGGSPVNVFLYVDDADAFATRAVAVGAKLTAPIEDKEYGRSGGLEDPFGLVWWICS